MGRQTWTIMRAGHPAPGVTGFVALVACLFGVGVAGAGQAATPSASGESELHWAVRFNAVEAIETLTAAGAEVDGLDGEGRTPLYWAAANRRRGGSQGPAGHGRGSDGGWYRRPAAGGGAGQYLRRGPGAGDADGGGGRRGAARGGVDRQRPGGPVADGRRRRRGVAARRGQDGAAAGGAGRRGRRSSSFWPRVASACRSATGRCATGRCTWTARADAGNAVAVLLAHGANIEVPKPAGTWPRPPTRWPRWRCCWSTARTRWPRTGPA